jgi:tRNA-splicing ligase RtcB
MFPIQGKYNAATVFTNNIDESAVKQLLDICNFEAFKESKIRIMPDVHAGAGCTIGTTMTIHDKVVPAWVGVDIGCGVDVVALEEKEIDFDRLDKIIRKNIPFGQNAHGKAVKQADQIDLSMLYCNRAINTDRAYKSIMSLGGGNHYIEANQGSDGTIYLCVHSGSRNPGKQCAEFYQKMAAEITNNRTIAREDVVSFLKKNGRESEIENELKHLKPEKIQKNMEYLTGIPMINYLHDMGIMQNFASINRRAILDHLIVGLRVTAKDRFSTIHNYIDLSNNILRKGAVSAQEGEKLIIPINMRDGAIIAVGKGNPEWNFSAPHGAGRIHSRRSAKESITLEEFQASMEGIWTSCVSQATVDESPMAYKPMDEIVACIGDTVDIIDVIKPLYNFKAS